MRIKPHPRSLLSSAAILTVLLMTTSLAPDAFAQKTTTLSPVTQWAVTNVAGGEAGPGAAYCAIARRFKQNTILTVAKNPAGETSFALDFQVPKFSVSRPLTVVLDPGAGEQRSYEISPVSAQAFVVRLGRDDAFFTALDKTGYLRAEVGTQTYGFNLADIDDGASRLDGCLASMITPAAGDEGDDGSATLVRSFRQEINALRRDIQDLRDENERLSGVVEGEIITETVTETKTVEVSDPKDLEKIEAGKKEIATLSDRLALLEGERDALSAQLTKLRASNDLTTIRSKADQSVLGSMKKENKRLRSVLQDQEKLVEGIPLLKAEIETLQKSNAHLKELSRRSREADTSVDQELVLQLTEENHDLKEKMREHSAVQMKLARLKGHVSSLEQVNTRLKSELSLAQDDVQEVKLVQARVQELEEQLKELKAQNITLAKDAETLRIVKAGAETQQTKTLKARVDALSAKISEKDAALIVLQQKLEMTDRGNKAYSAELAAMKTKVEGLRSQLKDKDQKLVELAALSVELESLKNTNKVLEDKLDEVLTETNVDSDKVALLAGKIGILESENSALKKQLDEVSSELSLASQDSKGFNKQILALRAENTLLQKSVDAQKSLAKDLSAARLELETLHASHEALRAQAANQVMSGKAQIANLGASLETALSANERLKSELDAAKIDVALLDDLKANLLELKRENAELMIRAQAQVQANVNTQAAKMDRELVLQSNMRALQDENKALQEKVAFLTTQHDERKSVHEAASELSVIPQEREDVTKLSDVAQEISQQGEPFEVIEAQDDFTGYAAIEGGRVREIHKAEALEAEALAFAKPQAQVQERETISWWGERVEPAEPVFPIASLPPVTPVASVDPVVPVSSVVPDTNVELSSPALAEVAVDDFVQEEVNVEQVAFAQEDLHPQHEITDTAVESAPNFYDPNFSIRDVLAEAEFSHKPQQFKLIEQASDSAKVAYEWQSDNIFGSAEQRPLFDESRFEELVQAYLEKTEKRCDGDFAIAPDNSRQVDGMRIDSYEIACVGSNISSSASLLFFNKSGTFTVMAHESAAKDLYTAMSMRDQLVETISGS